MQHFNETAHKTQPRETHAATLATPALSAIVLAAGEGTRMRSRKAKVLHEVCEVPMLFWVVEAALAVAGEVIVVLNYDYDAVKAALAARFEAQFAAGVVRIVRQDAANFPGTGGGVRAALGEVRGARALVVCGDTPLVRAGDLRRLCECAADVAVAAFECENPFGYGRVILAEDLAGSAVTSANGAADGGAADGENTSENGAKHSLNSNLAQSAAQNGAQNVAQNLPNSNLDENPAQNAAQNPAQNATQNPATQTHAQNPAAENLPPFHNARVAQIVEQKDATSAQRRVKICNAGAYCFESEFLKSAVFALKNDNAAREFYLTDAALIALKSGKVVRAVAVSEQDFLGVNDKAALAAAEVIKQREIRREWMLRGVVMHLPETIFISPHAVFEGECEIESGVVIKGRCHLKNALIKSGSVVEESFVEDSDIGPLAHLRAGCVVSGTHIGNFVELKKAHLRGVKAGHLSYLGDCEIGAGTNVGCGTITCNYDGVRKHRTVVGENVFIGSDTQLVAPVRIASNTLIAAGSTVTKDSEEGDLVISRTKQSNIKNGFWRFFK